MIQGVEEFEAHERQIRHRNIPTTALIAAVITAAGLANGGSICTGQSLLLLGMESHHSP